MKNQKWFIILSIILVFSIAIILGFYYLTILTSHQETHVHDHMEEGHTKEEEFTRGPHKGRLLGQNAFQTEITIYEPEGVPPRFRIYFYENGSPISPQDVHYAMELQRINRLQKIPFKQVNDFLESSVVASEPHSFHVKIHAVYKEKSYIWEYDSFEGRVELSPTTIENNKIKIDVAGPIDLIIKLNVMGKILPNEDQTVHITPRYPGIVKIVNKKLGDQVKKNDILAVVESNESLQQYEIRSELDGLIIKKNINPGMHITNQDMIFVISDLNSVWADFNIYRQDLTQVQPGSLIDVESLDGKLKQQSTIAYLSPLGNEDTQTILARAVLPNPNGVWKPGLFVAGEITVERTKVDVAVKNEALQTFRDWDVVFITVDNQFEVAPVKLGKHNKEWVEIKSGLSKGDRYASENSFIIKADIEKSGATHDH